MLKPSKYLRIEERSERKWEAWAEFINSMHGLVLNAGCGNGVTSYLVSEHNPAVTRIVSLDLQFVDRVHHGRVFLQMFPQGEFVQGDVQALPFPNNTFDSLMCLDVLQNVKDVSKTFKEFVRVCKQGAVVWIRALVKSDCGPVRVGAIEKGSSGYPFRIWWLWEIDELTDLARASGLINAKGTVMIDGYRNQNRLFRVNKNV